MLKNLIKIAFRNLLKNKTFSLINILGLAIGIATAILSFIFVTYELSYDNFHEKSDRTYRIAVDALSGNTVIKQVFTPAPMPAALYIEYPEIESVCRIAGSVSTSQVKYFNKTYTESRFLLVDTTFFNVFTAEFVYGTPHPSLLGPNKAVLTEKTARKYFGDSDPIGKIIEVDNEYKFQVTAVIKEFPENSHFRFDFLISLLSFDGFYNNTNWFNNSFRTYITLHKNSNYKQLEAKLPAFVNKYLYNNDYEKQLAKGNKWELYLQPLTSIHLNSHLSGEFEPNGRIEYIYIFSAAAILVLLIACINFINLSTARSSRRAVEIGIRKVVGSNRKELIIQFLCESFALSLISLIIALCFVQIAIIYLPDLLGIEINVPKYSILETASVFLGLIFVVGVLSGIYPAFVLSSFKPISNIKSNLLKGGKKAWSRGFLVIFQFIISIILIIGTIVISKQLNFVQNEQLGFDKEQVILIKNVNVIENQINSFKNELIKIPGVQYAAVSHSLPGIRFNNIGFGTEGFDGGFTLNICSADPEFQNVFKFKMVKGRFFSKDFVSDTSAVVLNEAAAKLIGWNDPTGRTIHNWMKPPIVFKIIGVVEDLHYESMHIKIRPMAFLHMNCSYHFTPGYISIRTTTNNIDDILNKMNNIWTRFSPQTPFEYSFFDQDYNKLYSNEAVTRKLFIVFSILAIFIACLGLLGLASFVVERRIQEIGIRKVLGASVSGLVLLLNLQFIKWVIIANLIAWPIAFFAAYKWLEGFAYRIEISWWIFIIAGIIALIIAFITVSFQAVKAAVSNPVDSLKYE